MITSFKETIQYYLNNPDPIQYIKGRTGNKEYGRYLLVAFFVCIAAAIIDVNAGTMVGRHGIVTSIIGYPLSYLLILLIIRRLHDINKSGWLALLIFVPVINVIGMIALVFLKSTNNPNQNGVVEHPFSYPDKLLEDWNWYLNHPAFSSRDDAMQQLDEHQKQMEDESANFDAVILNAASVKISFEYWGIEDDEEEEDLLTEVLELAAEGEAFTWLELCTKLHNSMSSYLQGQDKAFFEGLHLSPEHSTESTPFYWVSLGS